MPRSSLIQNIKAEIIHETGTNEAYHDEEGTPKIHSDTPFSPQDAKKFLTSFKERLEESSYSRPDQRIARSLAENENEMSSAREVRLQ